MDKIRAIFADTWEEMMTKVTWPTWEELQDSTVVVLIAAIILAACIYVIDIACGGVLGLIYQMFN